MKTKLLVIVIGVTILAVSILGILQSSKVATEIDYRGAIIFNTTEGYTDFKAYLLTEGVDINNVDVLSSEPPIWVNYDVTVGTDAKFPFPYDRMYHVVPMWYLSATGFGVALGILVLLSIGILGVESFISKRR